MSEQRICSLLPSATEIVCALGLFDCLVAVSHECDYPPQVRSLPVITSSRLQMAGLSGAQIDATVSETVHGHAGLYALDEELLARIEPTLILTQDLCEVCAVSYEQVEAAVRRLPGQQTILSLEPASLAGVLQTIAAVGEAAGREPRAASLVAELSERFRPRPAARALPAPRRVACLEWLDPPYAGGHWVPEMVDRAGAIDALAAPGDRSRRLTWDELAAADPEVCVLMPCGFDVAGTVSHYREANLPQQWHNLRAAVAGELYATDANAYFSRPGPRLARGIDILSEVLTASSSARTAGEGWQHIPPATNR